MKRRLLAALALAGLAFVMTARADLETAAKKKSDGRAPAEFKGDPRILINDSATRQAQLKRAFESVRQRLAVMAGRLENGTDKDREKAKSLRKALKMASELETEGKFDRLIVELTRPGADQSIDVLRAAVKDNAALRKDLQTLIALLTKDESQLNKEQMEKHARLLERIKELIAKQERVRAQTEMGRRNNKELKKDQNKVTKETRDVIDSKKKGDREGKDNEIARGEFKPGDRESGEGRGEARNDTKAKADGKPSEGKEGKAGESKAGESKGGKEGKPGEGKPGEGKPGDGKEGKPGEGKPGESKDGKPGESKNGAGKEGKPGEGKPGEGKPGEGKPGEGKPGTGKEGKPGEGKPGEGKPGSGKPGEGKPGTSKQGGKPGEGKPSDSKGQGEGKGEAKPGQPGEGKPGSSGKPGEGKPGSGKPSSGKPGSSKPGNQGNQGNQPPQDQQPDDNPVKKQIEDANKYQKQAEIELDRNKKNDASDNQTKAIKELEAAKKKLEDLLKQMREEEIERLLADLEKRCRYMLALQIEVRDGTVAVDREIEKNADRKPTLLQSARANKLGDKEDEIVREAHTALKLIRAEGSAVAFAEVFEQVSKDMEAVRARLHRTIVDAETQQIENDIIETLKEMIAALQKAQKEARQGKPSQSKGGMPQDQKLIDQIAELKMIYAMQKRVNGRTELYGQKYKGEQAPVPETAKTPREREHYELIERELKDLAVRQQKIGKVTRDIATGRNEAK